MHPDEIRLDLPEVSLRALAWGPADGPLALCLHGFPDTARTWRHLGPALAAAGWRVVAPYSRGYAPSEVARDGSGHVGALMSDAAGIHELLGGAHDAVLVGHDWGAITANALAAHADSPFARVVSLSVPPIAAMGGGATLRLLPGQLRRSWYIGFNQLPVLPERSLDRLVPKLWRDWSPGYDAAEDVADVTRSLWTPANRRAAIGYYRAMARPTRPPAPYRRWQASWQQPPVVPMLYLHGADDGCLSAGFAASVAALLPDGSAAHVVEGAGHFLQLEQPEVVNRLVVDFLGTA